MIATFCALDSELEDNVKAGAVNVAAIVVVVIGKVAGIVVVVVGEVVEVVGVVVVDELVLVGNAMLDVGLTGRVAEV